MEFKKILVVLIALTLANFVSDAQRRRNEVKIVGQMKDVMWRGQLQGNVNLDTIVGKKDLYGLGPVEYLEGEILIIDGKCYKSTVISNTAMKVEETFDIKAPFLCYANIATWTEQALPDSIQSIHQLELYLDRITKMLPRPFMFKLSGVAAHAAVHIVNLPEGAKVGSPEEAHRGQVNYKIANAPSHIVGFFSTGHKGIFTHHDTYLHMHLITNDRKKMGHLDEVLFEKGSMKLYLPSE